MDLPPRFSLGSVKCKHDVVKTNRTCRHNLTITNSSHCAASVKKATWRCCYNMAQHNDASRASILTVLWLPLAIGSALNTSSSMSMPKGCVSAGRGPCTPRVGRPCQFVSVGGLHICYVWHTLARSMTVHAAQERQVRARHAQAGWGVGHPASPRLSLVGQVQVADSVGLALTAHCPCNTQHVPCILATLHWLLRLRAAQARSMVVSWSAACNR
jgi:hypothetical protein